MPVQRIAYNTSVFAISLLLTLGSYLAAFANGKTDPFYLRFTTRPQKSMILGTSRAAQGIRPSVFNSAGLEFEGPLYNFSFTMSTSPMGPVYLESIQKKLDIEARNGIFILEVNPLSLSTDRANQEAHLAKTGNPSDLSWLREEASFVSRMEFVNVWPNCEYLFTEYRRPLYTLLLMHFRNRSFLLMPDGWLRNDVPISKESVAKRMPQKLENYRRNFETNDFSDVRMEYLQKTIRFLSPHGRVYLVRLPISVGMYELEKNFLPGFDREIELLCARNDAAYINLIESSGEYRTTDGNHLYRDDATLVSQEILAQLNAIDASS